MSHAELIISYCSAYGLRTVVETGSSLGWNANAVAESDLVDHVYTIELDHQRHIEAKEYNEAQPKVHCLEGDSAVHVKELAMIIEEPAVWFLDAHSDDWEAEGLPESPPTPLLAEMKAISSRNRPDVILIDDVRLMGKDGWPSVDEVLALSDGFRMDLKDDVLRFVR